MELLIVIAVIVVFDVAAAVLGADSRPQVDAGQHRSI
jgi:hypothetical protein